MSQPIYHGYLTLAQLVVCDVNFGARESQWLCNPFEVTTVSPRSADMDLDMEGSRQRYNMGYLGPEMWISPFPLTMSDLGHSVSRETGSLREGVCVKDVGLGAETGYLCWVQVELSTDELRA